MPRGQNEHTGARFYQGIKNITYRTSATIIVGGTLCFLWLRGGIWVFSDQVSAEGKVESGKK